VAQVVSSSSVCAGSPFGPTDDSPGPPIIVRFGTGQRVGSSVRPGAFVRVLRRVQYRFYRAGTGDWYLGYAEWAGLGDNVVQPVSGPFASYSQRGASGLAFRYFDESGVELVGPGDASRIDRVTVAARGVARGTVSETGAMTDSQVVGVRVRNR